jgi:hypothetical protein
MAGYRVVWDLLAGADLILAAGFDPVELISPWSLATPGAAPGHHPEHRPGLRQRLRADRPRRGDPRLAVRAVGGRAPLGRNRGF